MERHRNENLGTGDAGNLFATFIGWPSVEAHMEYRKTEDFSKLIPYLMEQVKEICVHHVAFKQYRLDGGARDGSSNSGDSKLG